MIEILKEYWQAVAVIFFIVVIVLLCSIGFIKSVRAHQFVDCDNIVTSTSPVSIYRICDKQLSVVCYYSQTSGQKFNMSPSHDFFGYTSSTTTMSCVHY
jgi:hypothetical protein